MKKLLLGILIILLLVSYIIKINIFNGKEDKGISILVDPGHGGKDSGTIGLDGTYEKDLSLEIGLKLGKQLEKEGYRVFYTRNEDKYIKPIDRGREANSLGVDMILSIHCNAIDDNKDERGIQLLYYPSERNLEKSQVLLEELIAKTRAGNKGSMERKDLILLNQSNMPAFIIEVGFMTNGKELKKLKSSSYQNRIVKGIVKGLNRIYIK